MQAVRPYKIPIFRYVTPCRMVNIDYLLFHNNNIYLLQLGGYFTCKQNMKLVITKFKSGGLHEKHVVATWNLGNHLSICL